MRTTLQKGEKILLVTYSSWTTLVIPSLFCLLLFAAGIFVVYHFQFAWGWLAPLLALSWWLFRYYTWKANIWVVTNFRVIDELGLFSHFAKESPLDKINNVSYNQTTIGRLFKYGHVKIQTAAQIGATDYFNVSNPRRLQDTITAAQAEYKNWEYGNQAALLAAAMDARNTQAGRNPANPANSPHNPANPGHNPASNAASPYAAGGAPNVAAELEKLFELKMKGALSEDEYNRAKARLLNH